MRSLLAPRRALALGGGVLAVAALVVGLIVSASDSQSGDAAVAAAKRKRAPEFVGDWLVGPPVRLADLRGRPALVNFWASWCVPCRKEAPELTRFDRELRGRARLVGVDFQDAGSDARAFIREFRWRFPNLRDPDGQLGGRYGLVGLPTTFVLDREGRIARALTGAQTYDTLVAAVQEVE
jgi:cytochrome c biogenesis protein CcmG/thiol:disulfide interchange protein DsbE